MISQQINIENEIDSLNKEANELELKLLEEQHLLQSLEFENSELHSEIQNLDKQRISAEQENNKLKEEEQKMKDKIVISL